MQKKKNIKEIFENENIKGIEIINTFYKWSKRYI